jgi:hypothetical protein
LLVNIWFSGEVFALNYVQDSSQHYLCTEETEI